MSFTPIRGGLSTALSGTVEPTKFMDAERYDARSDDLYSRRIHGPANKPQALRHTIIIVIISAIIFVTTVALYDVIRNAINVYFANLALTDPNSHNTPEEIENVQISNQNALWSSMVFAAVCILIAICLLYIIIKYIL